MKIRRRQRGACIASLVTALVGVVSCSEPPTTDSKTLVPPSSLAGTWVFTDGTSPGLWFSGVLRDTSLSSEALADSARRGMVIEMLAAGPGRAWYAPNPWAEVACRLMRYRRAEFGSFIFIRLECVPPSGGADTVAASAAVSASVANGDQLSMLLRSFTVHDQALRRTIPVTLKRIILP